MTQASAASHHVLHSSSYLQLTAFPQILSLPTTSPLLPPRRRPAAFFHSVHRRLPPVLPRCNLPPLLRATAFRPPLPHLLPPCCRGAIAWMRLHREPRRCDAGPGDEGARWVVQRRGAHIVLFYSRDLMWTPTGDDDTPFLVLHSVSPADPAPSSHLLSAVQTGARAVRPPTACSTEVALLQHAGVRATVKRKIKVQYEVRCGLNAVCCGCLFTQN
ncbi:hypothetical protein ACQJBY_009960 [Aegilops geniculata]